ncbi:hypothetical protein M153_1120003765 [Pseudoloma neurophilia]|uniref:Uncharacterized protein n=1 Tax=Pseudoloma neurophilia TaxID=146866 RepID=A0A0R0M0N1_9MICR|nr:hypothetical protein M153_1120003765 [Pseudoloma neurophilia]
MSKSHIDTVSSSLDPITSQDEFLLNLCYDPIVAEENRSKVNMALQQLKNDKKEYVDVYLSKSRILHDISQECLKSRKKNKEGLIIVSKEKLTELDEVKIQKHIQGKKLKKDHSENVKRQKSKSYFENNNCQFFD